MSTNGVILQAFHWYSHGDGEHWSRLADNADGLARSGITAVWIPPCYKGSGGVNDVGYGIYDLFDLGEFDQHGTTRTKYGTKAQLLDAVQRCQAAGLQVYADVVINHRMGGKEQHNVWAVHVSSSDRNHEIGQWHPRTVWTRFDFPGRGDTHSSMKWSDDHFDAVCDYKCIFKLKGKRFETHVDEEYGNYDALMGCDLDYDHPEVRGEIDYWGRWFFDQTGVDGFRVDAVKHVRSFVFRDWLDQLRHHAWHHVNDSDRKPLFAVGEYWSNDINRLHRFLDQTGGRLHLFDVPLHYRFHQASKMGSAFDLQTIFDGTLTQQQPSLSVSFVDNHDSQPLQSLESWVEAWFKPLAYALAEQSLDDKIR